MSRLSITQLLAVNKYVVDDKEHHIAVDKQNCAECAGKPCIYACPAGLYTLKGEEVSFDDAGCLECGTCRVICPQNIGWQYPRGGFGIIYRYG